MVSSQSKDEGVPADPRNQAGLSGLSGLAGLSAGFVWGAATSACQIEGAADQRGQSIWDTFCHENGRIRDGSDATVACDHVHRYAEDVALLRGLGVERMPVMLARGTGDAWLRAGWGRARELLAPYASSATATFNPPG